jgi:hypothetical protein
MVDVSPVRDILSKIRRVVTGDIILPEDHNYQTDAIAKLTDIVETISPPGGAAEIPIIFPFPYPAEGFVDWHDTVTAPFMPYEDVFFIMPFNVKLKKWFFVVTYNEHPGTTILSLLDNDNTFASVEIPAGSTGTYSIQLNDYLFQEGHKFTLLCHPTQQCRYTCYLFIESMWVLGVIV